MIRLQHVNASLAHDSKLHQIYVWLLLIYNCILQTHHFRFSSLPSSAAHLEKVIRREPDFLCCLLSTLWGCHTVAMQYYILHCYSDVMLWPTGNHTTTYIVDTIYSTDHKTDVKGDLLCQNWHYQINKPLPKLQHHINIL